MLSFLFFLALRHMARCKQYRRKHHGLCITCRPSRFGFLYVEATWPLKSRMAAASCHILAAKWADQRKGCKRSRRSRKESDSIVGVLHCPRPLLSLVVNRSVYSPQKSSVAWLGGQIEQLENDLRLGNHESYADTEYRCTS